MTTFVSWLVLFHFAATLAVTVAEKNTEFVKGKTCGSTHFHFFAFLMFSEYRRLDRLQTAPYQKRGVYAFLVDYLSTLKWQTGRIMGAGRGGASRGSIPTYRSLRMPLVMGAFPQTPLPRFSILRTLLRIIIRLNSSSVDPTIESILSQETIEVVRFEASVHPRSLRKFYIIPLFLTGRFPPSVSPLTLPSRSTRRSSLGEGRPLLKERATRLG
uniref:Secreted protein n=1 Tax=Timema monikensis TaxID=170555 RepID=A0A7R9EFD5_9NEOP|nr:unnamed protein product [Timema monikensis]